MPVQPTRRDALRRIAAAAAAPVGLIAVHSTAEPLAQAAPAYAPQTFAESKFQLLETLVEMIIPASETPGASAAGVHRIIDEYLSGDPDISEYHDGGGDLARDANLLKRGMAMLVQEGFDEKEEEARVELLTEYSETSGEKRDFFELLKELTCDSYYSTEEGLMQELGYVGNTYLPEFPGCGHEEHLNGD